MGSQFFDKEKFLCLGIIVITKNENNKIVYNKFTCLSEFLKQGSLTVSVAFKMIFESEQFKNLNISKISVWSDKGKHFSNYDFMGFFYHLILQKTIKDSNDMDELKKLEKIIDLSAAIYEIEHSFTDIFVNFFVEYHGKFIVDSHFSYISHLMQIIKHKEYDVTNVNKLSNALRQVMRENKENSFENERIQTNQNDRVIINHILEIKEEHFMQFAKEKQTNFRESWKEKIISIQPDYYQDYEEHLPNQNVLSQNRNNPQRPNLPQNPNNSSQRANNNNSSQRTNNNRNNSQIPIQPTSNSIFSPNDNQTQDLFSQDPNTFSNTFRVDLPIYNTDSQNVESFNAIFFPVPQGFNPNVIRRRVSQDSDSFRLSNSSSLEDILSQEIHIENRENENQVDLLGFDQLYDSEDDQSENEDNSYVDESEGGQSSFLQNEVEQRRNQNGNVRRIIVRMRNNQEGENLRMEEMYHPFTGFSQSVLKFYSSFHFSSFTVDKNKVFLKKDYSSENYLEFNPKMTFRYKEETKLWSRKSHTHGKSTSKLHSPQSFSLIMKKLEFSKSPEKNPNKVFYQNDISLEELSKSNFPNKVSNSLTTSNSIIKNKFLIERAKQLLCILFFYNFILLYFIHYHLFYLILFIII